MEYALEGESVCRNQMKKEVLILVLMEYALEDSKDDEGKFNRYVGLNPCFNGICSRRVC